MVRSHTQVQYASSMNPFVIGFLCTAVLVEYTKHGDIGYAFSKWFPKEKIAVPQVMGRKTYGYRRSN